MGKTSKTNLPKETVEAIASIAGKAGAKAAAEFIAQERKREKESRYDRRLGNTKLLLENYRMFKEHCSRAVFDSSQLDENAIDILDLMWGRDGDVFVESIKKSAQRTQIILRHIDEMLDAYAGLCKLSGREEEMRRMRAVLALYIENPGKTIQEISELEKVNTSTIYRDIAIATEKLTGLIFGLDGLNSAVI
ncbi:MAG: hypothetical protein PUK18_02625 [Firmicutes bacterium]|nr:hypothetical protein [Bacillota bacterium]MDY6159336.1 hypothetical protein [Candidatus Faecousia sp.]